MRIYILELFDNILSPTGSLIFATFIFIWYILPNPFKGNHSLNGGVTVALSAFSIFGGLKVVLIAFYIEKCFAGKIGQVEQIYLFIGGLVTVWLSSSEIWKKFQEKNLPANPTP